MLLKSSCGGFVVVEERKKKPPKLERQLGLDGISPQPELGNVIGRSYSTLPGLRQRLKLTFHFYTLWLIQ